MKSLRVVLAVLLLSIVPAAGRCGEIVVSTPLIDFGPVSVFGPPAFNGVTITNVGSPTTVNGLSQSGPGCAPFAIIGGLFPVQLGNGQAMQLTVNFDPSTRGTFGCFVTVLDEDANTDTFQLVGVGTAPRLSVAAPSFPLPLIFADQPWDGGTPETLLVEIVNTGNEAVEASHYLAVFSEGQHFSALSPTFPIAKGATAFVPVVFDPASDGFKSDLLAFPLDNDLPEDPTGLARVEGMGTSPKVGVEPAPGALGLRLLGANPVGDGTRLFFGIPRRGRVQLGLYDVSGRLILPLLDHVEEAGGHEWAWPRAASGALPPGVYLVRMSFEGVALGTSRIVLL